MLFKENLDLNISKKYGKYIDKQLHDLLLNNQKLIIKRIEVTEDEHYIEINKLIDGYEVFHFYKIAETITMSLRLENYIFLVVPPENSPVKPYIINYEVHLWNNEIKRKKYIKFKNSKNSLGYLIK